MYIQDDVLSIKSIHEMYSTHGVFGCNKDHGNRRPEMNFKHRSKDLSTGEVGLVAWMYAWPWNL